MKKLHIPKHINVSKLLDSTSKNTIPGLDVIVRDVGIDDDYNISFEEQENKRINQNSLL